MPRLLAFMEVEPLASAVTASAQACGWEVVQLPLQDSGALRKAVQDADAALFDLQQGREYSEPAIQESSQAAPFLPLILLSADGTALHESGTGLRYHLDPGHLPDLEHILLSLSLGFPGESFGISPPPEGKRVPRVLVLDDNVRLAALLGRTLRSLEKFDVHVTSSGYEAVSMLPTFQPDVAIIDLVLNDMDGREICSFIRKHEKLQHTKIIGVSGYLSKDRTEELNLDVDLFLEKPFRMSDILEKVMAFLA
jgi:CheY-like chemotaxis protein